mmetsp:Transcript_15997/g.17886  ORF Transcript_15997/g.17886 Transcript_15997/m.17886 type:complete len:510 (-) Transcript_15997:856-2385(-)
MNPFSNQNQGNNPNTNAGNDPFSNLTNQGAANPFNSQMNQMNQMGQMGQMNQMGQLNQMGQINQMGQMGQMNQMGQMGQLNHLNQLEMNGQIGQMQYGNLNSHGMNSGGSPNLQGQKREVGTNQGTMSLGRSTSNSGGAVSNGHSNSHSPQKNKRSQGQGGTQKNQNRNRRGGKHGQFERSYSSNNDKDFIENAYFMSKDQAGCRTLQRKLDERNPEVNAEIFEKVIPHLDELMLDPFGNYLCQKVMEIANADQLSRIVRQVSRRLVEICLNSHGTRAAQKLIELVHRQQDIECIILSLRGAVVPLVKDLNGNHVVQRCLNTFKAPNNQFVYDAMEEGCVPAGTHKHGCCVMQRCIDAAQPEQLNQLVNAVIRSTMDLIEDPYGNYVVQYVLEQKNLDHNAKIARQLHGSLMPLSKQKFSSNVIEKSLELSGDRARAGLIEELCTYELHDLLLNEFGNYVIQKALEVAKPPLREKLLGRIKPCMDKLKAVNFGKKLHSKFLKKFPQLAS